MINLRRHRDFSKALHPYCFARILAERFGYALEVVGLRYFPGTCATVKGDEVFGPPIHWSGQWPFETLSGRRIESAELEIAPGGRLILTGEFQRFGLIAAERERIREDWLLLPERRPVRPVGDFAISLLPADHDADSAHTFDLTSQGGQLTEGQIRRLAATVPHKDLYLIVERRANERIASLRDLRPKIIVASGIEAVHALQSFQKLAIGQSTLAWWAAFLGDASEVYFPPCENGPWSHPEPAFHVTDPKHHGIDLRVDEKRYIYDWLA